MWMPTLGSNIICKGENAGYNHFLLFTQCFEKRLFLKGVKSAHSMVKGNKKTMMVLYRSP